MTSDPHDLEAEASWVSQLPKAGKRFDETPENQHNPPADSNLKLLSELIKLSPFLGLLKLWGKSLFLSESEAERLDKLREDFPKFFRCALIFDFIFTALAAGAILVAGSFLVLGAAWKLGFG